MIDVVSRHAGPSNHQRACRLRYSARPRPGPSGHYKSDAEHFGQFVRASPAHVIPRRLKRRELSASSRLLLLQMPFRSQVMIFAEL